VPVPVPDGVVTETFTAPTLPGGVAAGGVATMVVAVKTVKLVAALPPNVTVVAPVKLVPLTVTTVPPRVVPLLARTDVTVGAAMTY
jgi:hypothetical protein